MAQNSYRTFTTSLTAVAGTPVWSPVVIPAGAIDATITLQDNTIAFRVNSTGLGGPTNGVYVAAAGGYTFPGVCAQAVTLYVCSDAATNAVLQVQT